VVEASVGIPFPDCPPRYLLYRPSGEGRIDLTIEQILAGKVVSEILINTASGPLASIITTGSVKRMKLKKGDAVFAIIKATEVSVEKESSSPSTTARIRRRTKPPEGRQAD
jgi:molybdopterin-binding protein